MDEKFLEQAGDYADGMVAKGITMARAQSLRPDGFDGSCTCGADIPVERVALNLFNCVDCQTTKERRKKYYGS